MDRDGVEYSIGGNVIKRYRKLLDSRVDCIQFNYAGGPGCEKVICCHLLKEFRHF